MKRILILSGGGCYGSFEMGIVSKLIEQDKGGWDLITGVSAGSINACYLSTISKEDEITSIKEFKNLWLNIKSKDVFTNCFFLNGLSLYDSKPMEGFLEKLFLDRISLRPVIISATSLSESSSRIFTNKDIKEYGFKDLIMCSTAIPILFPPYAFLDDVFIDGGLSSNIVFYEAINYCLENFPDENIHVDIIVCGQKIKKDHVNKDNLNFIKLSEKLVRIIKQQVEYSELLNNIEFPSKIHITVYQEKIDSSISLIDFSKTEELWNDGYTFSNVETYEIQI